MSQSERSPEQGIASPRILFAVWLAIGLQSFGGGSATLALVRRTFIDRYASITDAEFVRDWAICQIAPGINLIAMTALIGKRIAGAPGVVASVLGLLLPSVTVTALISAAYVHIRSLPMLQAALRGIIPATVGLGIATGWQMLAPSLSVSRRSGPFAVAVAIVLLSTSASAVGLFHFSPLPVLLAAGAAGATLFRRPQNQIPVSSACECKGAGPD